MARGHCIQCLEFLFGAGADNTSAGAARDCGKPDCQQPRCQQAWCQQPRYGTSSRRHLGKVPLDLGAPAARVSSLLLEPLPQRVRVLPLDLDLVEDVHGRAHPQTAVFRERAHLRARVRVRVSVSIRGRVWLPSVLRERARTSSALLGSRPKNWLHGKARILKSSSAAQHTMG